MTATTTASEDAAFQAEGSIRDAYGFTGFTSPVTLEGYDDISREWVPLASGSDYGWLTAVRSEYAGVYPAFRLLDHFGDEADMPEVAR